MKSKLVVVFGVSQGLGRSLVENYLSLNVNVIGVGRRNSIIHNCYTFLERDLSLAHDWSELIELIPDGVEEIELIYNAGSLGEVRLIEDVTTNPQALFQLNVISWMEIVGAFLKSLSKDVLMHFVSISSGAGRRGIPGWSQYGSTKAAMDNFMLTLKEELLLKDSLSKVYSLSPGVMDTGMQEIIRGLSDKDFPQVQNYIRFNTEGSLRPVTTIAQALIHYLNLPVQQTVLIGVQDLSL